MIAINATPRLTYSPATGNAKLSKLERDYVRPKLGGKLYTFSILSGRNCPWAHNCKSTAHVGDDGRRWIVDGADTEFRCFSASQETLYPALYDQRDDNGGILAVAARSVRQAAGMLVATLPSDAAAIRLRVGGDFRTLAYFDAWRLVASWRPQIRFYAYTKALPLWIKRRDAIPENFVLTASYGGKRDDLIAEHGLRFARVVLSESEAQELGLAIDHDDSHAIERGESFALLIHGVQPKGTAAAAAVADMRRQLGRRGGAIGYGKGGAI